MKFRVSYRQTGIGCDDLSEGIRDIDYASQDPQYVYCRNKNCTGKWDLRRLIDPSGKTKDAVICGAVESGMGRRCVNFLHYVITLLPDEQDK